jgi:hypothetical protein
VNAVVTPPLGIKLVVPLAKTHRVQLVQPGMAPPFSLGLHAVPLGASEFALALRDYPIVFLQQAADAPLEAVAILGMHEGQNLFVMPDGRWDRRTYIPAFIRRYPFSVAPPPPARAPSASIRRPWRRTARRCSTSRARRCSTGPCSSGS